MLLVHSPCSCSFKPSFLDPLTPSPWRHGLACSSGDGVLPKEHLSLAYIQVSISVLTMTIRVDFSFLRFWAAHECRHRPIGRRAPFLQFSESSLLESIEALSGVCELLPSGFKLHRFASGRTQLGMVGHGFPVEGKSSCRVIKFAGRRPSQGPSNYQHKIGAGWGGVQFNSHFGSHFPCLRYDVD